MRWLATALVLTTTGSAFGTGQHLRSAEEWSEVSGVVTDVSGAVVVHAEVFFSCGGAIVKARTGEKGFAVKLRSGNCSVTTHASGFESKTITDLQIHAPQPIILNVVLQVDTTQIRIIADPQPPSELVPIPTEKPPLLIDEVVPWTANPDCHAIQAAPICSVITGSADYDGKTITVRGLYRAVPHGSVLMSSGCQHDLVNMRRATDYKADKRAERQIRSLTKKNQFQSVDVVVRGTFKRAHQGECFGQNCLSYEIEDHELLCAEPPKQ